MAIRFASAFCLLLAWSAPASADMIWIGAYQHDVRLSQEKFESGQDLKAGWIGNPIKALRGIGRPAPHVIISTNLDGGTDYIAAGLNWTFGSKLYVRPGIGIAVNNGPRRAYRNGRRVDLGSPVTFEPELALGWRISDRIATEASWIHLSHATLFSEQNRGLDSVGLRLLLKLP
ncbi:deacylase [Sphingomonas sp. DBB INV C78]|uniref:acyloxyacyl hydrolase n=1 Tax=Sphingomonas sp. DBB INV C78 TaxID=3349434 RepID=UPI0036D30937